MVKQDKVQRAVLYSFLCRKQGQLPEWAWPGEDRLGHCEGSAGAEPGSGGYATEEFGSVLQQENKTLLWTVEAM